MQQTTVSSSSNFSASAEFRLSAAVELRSEIESVLTGEEFQTCLRFALKTELLAVREDLRKVCDDLKLDLLRGGSFPLKAGVSDSPKATDTAARDDMHEPKGSNSPSETGYHHGRRFSEAHKSGKLLSKPGLRKASTLHTAGPASAPGGFSLESALPVLAEIMEEEPSFGVKLNAAKVVATRAEARLTPRRKESILGVSLDRRLSALPGMGMAIRKPANIGSANSSKRPSITSNASQRIPERIDVRQGFSDELKSLNEEEEKDQTDSDLNSEMTSIPPAPSSRRSSGNSGVAPLRPPGQFLPGSIGVVRPPCDTPEHLSLGVPDELSGGAEHRFNLGSTVVSDVDDVEKDASWSSRGHRESDERPNREAPKADEKVSTSATVEAEFNSIVVPVPATKVSLAEDDEDQDLPHPTSRSAPPNGEEPLQQNPSSRNTAGGLQVPSNPKGNKKTATVQNVADVPIVEITAPGEEPSMPMHAMASNASFRSNRSNVTFCSGMQTNSMVTKRMTTFNQDNEGNMADEVVDMESEDSEACLGDSGDDNVKRPRPKGLFVKRIIGSSAFKSVVAFLILVSVLNIGLQTEWLISNIDSRPPEIFYIVEASIGVLFFIEISLRIFACRFDFFVGPDYKWNLFDLLCVMQQVISEVFDRLVDEGAVPFAMSFMRVIRGLRIARIIRAGRLLKLFNGMDTIIISLFGSIRALSWTLMLLFVVIYVVAVFLTQVVAHRLQEIAEGFSDADADADAELRHYYGSLIRTSLSLYQAILNGLDWADMMEPLIKHISPTMGIFFCLYMAFTVLALMNIVTGTFVDSALKNAKETQESNLLQLAKHLFENVDHAGEGLVHWSEFEAQLDNPIMVDFFKAIDIDVSSAQSVFELLDVEDSGALDLDQLMSGVLRLRGPAKAADLSMLMYENRRMKRKQFAHIGIIEHRLRTLIEKLEEEQEEYKSDGSLRKKVGNGGAMTPPPLDLLRERSHEDDEDEID